MKYRYFHDDQNKTVYKVSIEPRCLQTKDKTGEVTKWTFSLDVKIANANNKLIHNQWLYPTSDPRLEVFYRSTYNAEMAQSFYMMRHGHGKGVEILEDEYARLHLMYEAEALSN